MSNKCELTGKRPLKGHNISHANNKTKRKFNPSIKKAISETDRRRDIQKKYNKENNITPEIGRAHV